MPACLSARRQTAWIAAFRAILARAAPASRGCQGPIRGCSQTRRQRLNRLLRTVALAEVARESREGREHPDWIVVAGDSLSILTHLIFDKPVTATVASHPQPGRRVAGRALGSIRMSGDLLRLSETHARLPAIEMLDGLHVPGEQAFF